MANQVEARLHAGKDTVVMKSDIYILYGSLGDLSATALIAQQVGQFDTHIIILGNNAS